MVTGWRGVEVQLHYFFNLALDGVDNQRHNSAALTQVKTPVTLVQEAE
jgi:hypothetical protein